MAAAAACRSRGSQLIDAAKLVGKLVARTPPDTSPLSVSAPSTLTPCWASFAYVYCCTPSRPIAGAAWVCSCSTFSSSVRRDTRSAARSAKEYRVSR